MVAKCVDKDLKELKFKLKVTLFSYCFIIHLSSPPLFFFNKYTLPLELINQQNLTEWIEILKTVVDRDVPAVSGFWLFVSLSLNIFHLLEC